MTGWGVLDIASAVRQLDNPLPEGDRYELNDQVANAAELWGRKGQRVRATIDYWDDRQDIYKIRVRAGQIISREAPRPRGHGHEPLPLEARYHVSAQRALRTTGSSPVSRRRRGREKGSASA